MNANATRLAGVTRQLWTQWQETRQSWNDAKSDEFERKYLQELMASVDKSVTIVEELDKLLTKIKQDCE